MIDQAARDYIAQILKSRGYAHRSHRLLAAHDLPLLKALNAVPMHTYVVQRQLSMAEKELLLIPSFTCLRAQPSIIAAHIRKGLDLGLCLGSIRESIEIVALEGGFNLLTEGLAAYRNVIAERRIEGDAMAESATKSPRESSPAELGEDLLGLCHPGIREALATLQAAIAHGDRALDARMRALLTISIMVCLKASQARIRSAIQSAIEIGVSAQEVLEALEILITPAGLPVFEHGIVAWAEATGAQTIDVEPSRDGAL